MYDVYFSQKRCTNSLLFIQIGPIPRWPSVMLKAIGTGGRVFDPRPGLAVPQKLLQEWPISV